MLRLNLNKTHSLKTNHFNYIDMSLFFILSETFKVPKEGDLIQYEDGSLDVLTKTGVKNFKNFSGAKVVLPYAVSNGKINEGDNYLVPDNYYNRWTLKVYFKDNNDATELTRKKVVMHPANFRYEDLVEIKVKDGDSLDKWYTEDKAPETDSTGFNHFYPHYNEPVERTDLVKLRSLDKVYKKFIEWGYNHSDSAERAIKEVFGNHIPYVHKDDIGDPSHLFNGNAVYLFGKGVYDLV
jgi:hypothetical protein